MTNQLDGLVFTKNELLVLLDAVNASYLVGIDQNGLIPQTQDEHTQAITTGIESLIERELMKVEADFHVLAPTLLQIAQVVARPELVSVATRTETDGTRRFTWFQAANSIVEHTQPTADSYRFVIIPNATALVSRIQFLFPHVEQSGAVERQMSIVKDTFLEINSMVQQGDIEKALDVLVSEGVAAEDSGMLLNEMQHFIYSGNLTFMRLAEAEVVEGKDIAILGGENDTWIVNAQQNDPNVFECKTVNAHSFGLLLFDSIIQVLEPENI